MIEISKICKKKYHYKAFSFRIDLDSNIDSDRNSGLGFVWKLHSHSREEVLPAARRQERKSVGADDDLLVNIASNSASIWTGLRLCRCLWLYLSSFTRRSIFFKGKLIFQTKIFTNFPTPVELFFSSEHDPTPRPRWRISLYTLSYCVSCSCEFVMYLRCR